MKIIVEGSLYVDAVRISGVKVTGKTSGVIVFHSGAEISTTADEASAIIAALNDEEEKQIRPDHASGLLEFIPYDWQKTSELCTTFTEEAGVAQSTFYIALKKLDDEGKIQRRFNRVRRIGK